MRVKALVNFSGVLSMYQGQEVEITNKEILNDLLNCGYVEEVEVEKPTKKKAVKKIENQ